ncbi:serine/threonine-protein phosphatase 6 regulatory subunit 3-like isoform X1 [Rhagoletis pomonella]|uniref:serine/threonine-protein phosphatase 6 regulatory subunit 3-like isoform X1 n=1 Tax=Rhagoletis pomonella TaxID=28610 RepID=UPI001784D4AC|nr:serine/threonine-protein phosphatase 6 regulatory subunit 3-like isoform X1 [Rhagoletis pomonella]XP_036337691.1 serine/threonine-protein phosphatase 6 regulatory subunit 3-like isoform X1 [Rhagoletis pomonella]XP_036337692.1 serine/threonine-protein phosphatase 6 regulatory subunit 3-like isoform X1 [Rhagoletis pomonella]XP_036337693.1 serine/threonine-protein phosphatase 6 regulatory subunit 3-like isoform X1 [Rhagoletis pomonella]XP_036337694.1 serine/threonine-protein phosphatase 6 regul
MFWDKSYTPSQNIEALLEKENVTVEEFLDDDDILLECRSQKKSIVNYLTRPDVIKRLVELITTEPSEDLPLAQRYRHANMACEILTFGLPSLDEKLLSDEDILKTLYSYLENEPPLNPLLSSFFSKTFSMLFTKKAEQDWFLYQQMCLKLLEYIKSQNNFLDLICKHFFTPVIPDLIMQMMREVEGGQMKRNLYQWLTDDKLVERLIAIIGNPQETDKHANVSEFLCDLILQGRSMRHMEQENDSFEPTFDGSNPILKCIESEQNIEALLNVILEPNAQQSAVVSGISVVLMLLKPVVFTEEPSSDRMKFIQNREKEIREQILSTVIRVIAPRLNDFNELLRNPPNKPEIVTTAAKLSQPFGMTRLQICRIFTVLLQTKNEEILKAVCETDFFETLLILFKQYCWNNFLHSEVEKCLHLVFYTQLSNNNNSLQGSTIVNDGSFGKTGNSIEHTSFFDFVFKSDNKKDDEANDESSNVEKVDEKAGEKEDIEMKTDEKIVDDKVATTNEEAKLENKLVANLNAMETDDGTIEKVAENNEDKSLAPDAADEHKSDAEESEQNKTQVHTDSGPSALQMHVIEKCKLISKLIDCWKHNSDTESAEKGRRLGYMGHLIKIFKHIANSISESEHIGALIESNLRDEFELKLWQSIINPTDGDLTKALATQSKMLANCNAHEAGDYSQHLPKDFLGDNSTWDYVMSSNVMSTNMINNLGFSDSGSNDIVFALEHDIYRNNLLENDDNAENDLNLFQFGRNIDDDDDDDDENNAGGDGSGVVGGGGSSSSLFGKNAVSTSALQAFGVTNNPWDHMDPFSDLTANSNSTPWAADFNTDNFADFDSHFSSFTNDLGESLVSAATISTTPGTTSPPKENSNNDDDASNNGGSSDGNQLQPNATDNGTTLSAIGRIAASTITSDDDKSETGYDDNANVEKSVTLETQEIGEFADGTDAADDLDDSNEKALATSLVRTLQSVMQDSEDDYEDDEGMWTKPLGGSAVDAHDDDESDEGEPKSDNELRFTNGPSSKDLQENENSHKLNKTDDDDCSTIAMAHINDIEVSENIKGAAAAAAGGDIKRTNSSTSLNAGTSNDVAAGCNTAAVPNATATTTTPASNAVEIVPTTT